MACGTAIFWTRGEQVHFEILVEDLSGKIVLEAVTGRIVGANHTSRIISYRGVGRIPENLRGSSDPRSRILLDRLPRLLRGYGRSLKGYPAAVVVVVDLDSKDCLDFKQEMLDVLDTCNPKPTTLFRIAIEEIEAWLLGDANAIRTAYPGARVQVLNSYVQDSVCGTWETLADAIHPGGSHRLKKAGYPHVGRVKCDWATNIARHLNPDRNLSRSFQVFRDGLRNLARSGARSGC